MESGGGRVVFSVIGWSGGAANEGEPYLWSSGQNPGSGCVFRFGTILYYFVFLFISYLDIWTILSSYWYSSYTGQGIFGCIFTKSASYTIG